MTVSSQEIAAFLGDHVDQELQRSGADFSSIIANHHGGFRAGCALMDVLNKVEEVQARIREALGRDGESRQALEAELLKVRVVSLYLLYGLYNYLPIQQNPFLCFLVDLYSAALHDDHLKPERFVTSVILNGDGEELAPSTPSELITIAQEVGSKSVQLQIFEELLPEVSIEDQVVPGLGWKSFNPSQGRRGDRQGIWETFLLEHQNCPIISATLPMPSTITLSDTEKEDEEALEEWEIEAEKRFKDSDAEDAPAPPPRKPVSKLKRVEEAPNRQQLNSIMEQASVQALTFDQEQLMLTQFAPDAVKVHIPLPSLDALPGIVDNNPTIAFNLLLHLIQMSSDLDIKESNGKLQNGKSGKPVDSPEPSIVDGYLDTMTHSKRLTLHSLEVVNRLTGATALSPQFLHAYIENAIRCCEMVDDKVGQARVVRMLCVFIQSLLRNDVITIPGYYHALQSFCVQFSRVKEVAVLFQTLVEFQRKMDGQSPVQEASETPTTTTTTANTTTNGNGGSSRTSWLASSGSISHAKPLSKPGLNGFSTPGALSQFIHPGPSSPSPSGSTNGTSFFKTHHKHSSQHSSSSSLFSTPTVMSASVSAFNSGFGSSGLALNGSSGSKDSKDTNGGHGYSHSFSQGIRRGGLGERDYDLEAALRASLRDMEAHSGSPSSTSSSGPGSGTASGTVRTPNNGLSQQQPQLSQLGKGISSHLGSQPRGRGARRGG
ncbi:hypothetical protein MVEG_05885 [Podila verticillata NRRL 6337]|nr:hypothetical protein MVEG_05885 [Podila verticillata NRRL 6337]